MVACTLNYNICCFRVIDLFNQWFCISAIYIYLILMNREKGLETIVILTLVSLIVYLKFDATWAIYIALGLLGVSVISKRAAIIIGKSWFSFSHYFGVVMNQIIMFLIFYGVLVPLSFFQRLMGSNQILKKNKSNSYFHHRNHLFAKKDIERPW